MDKKEAAGRLMILFGSFMLVLLLLFSYDSSEITGNFFANDNSGPIIIKSLSFESGILNIAYSFDNSYFSEDNIDVDIWISDDKNLEIKRIKDSFPNQENSFREMAIDLNAETSGFYYIYLAPSSSLGDYARGSFVVGESLTTGNSILENPRDKMIAYAVFLVIIGIGILLIIISNWFKKEKIAGGKVSGKSRK